ncbi:MAG: GTP-binding protein [Leucobacter sp.]
MPEVDVLAVVGTCAPERELYAERLAAVTDRTLFSARRLSVSADPVDEALALVPWTDRPSGAVVEFPSDTRIVELIGAAAEPESTCALSGIVCVADAAHLIDDLRRDSYAAKRHTAPHGGPGSATTEFVAHALLTVTQLEYASMIVLVNWQQLATPNLAALMALVGNLSPHARLRLDHGALEPPTQSTTYSAAQERAGWIAILNGDHDPYMTDRRVSSLHYEQVRPLHPERLERLLDDRIDAGEFGTVIRSAGFCGLASRPGIIGEWDHVGHMFSLEPLGPEADAPESSEVLAVGQDLAFIGIDMDAEALRAALDEAALTDEELAAGPEAWVAYRDPFPAWVSASSHSE